MQNIETASREIFWNVSAPIHQVMMYVVFVLSLILFGYGFIKRILLWRAGKKDTQHEVMTPKAFLIFLRDGLFQRKVASDKEAGLFHSLISFGFMVLVFTTTMVFLDHDLGFDIYKGKFYLAVTVASDVFGFLLFVGILLATARRKLEKPDRVHSTSSDFLVLAILAVLVVQGFILEGVRIKVTNDPWSVYSPVGLLVAKSLWMFSDKALVIVHGVTWWIHALTFFAALAILPYTKFFHLLASPTNLLFSAKKREKGALSYPGDIQAIMENALSSEDGEISLGVSSLKDLTWKQRLDLDACTSCGRCQEVCPAYRSGKALSPKWLILDTRDHMLTAESEKKKTGFLQILDSIDSYLLKTLLLIPNAKANRSKNELVNNSRKEGFGKIDSLIASDVMSEDVFWSCTTCRACEEVCPVGIEHVDLITDVRRSMVLLQGALPNEAQPSLRAIENRGNPLGDANARVDWAKDISVPIAEPNQKLDVLYWVGCISAYDKRKQSIARSLAKILNSSGLTWAILGNKEHCSGDPARRLGEENLFQSKAKYNVELIKSIECKTIVANCPHCFNTLKNEYPDVADWDRKNRPRIVHHTELIQELLQTGKIQVDNKEALEVTFHDPCYLGRYNDQYKEPRDILVQLGHKNKEMKEHGKKAMCCGAGGGHYWMDMKVGTRVNTARAEHALETGAQVVATGCPFCMQMLEDGIKISDKEEALVVKDIAELVADKLISN